MGRGLGGSGCCTFNVHIGVKRGEGKCAREGSECRGARKVGRTMSFASRSRLSTEQRGIRRSKAGAQRGQREEEEGKGLDRWGCVRVSRLSSLAGPSGLTSEVRERQDSFKRRAGLGTKQRR